MDPRTNPYAPGAGTTPPELAGRDDIIEKAAIALDRCRNELPLLAEIDCNCIIRCTGRVEELTKSGISE